ncbi:MAG: WD40/YVTN/BNR-like repeat-containing protein [Rariglobus sp.]
MNPITPTLALTCSRQRSATPRGLFAAFFFTCRLVALSVVAMVCTAGTRAADLSATYAWNSVRIGAGGYVTGFVTHPLNANVRYCRTDVGNAYRWDAVTSEWIPMIVRNADGTGLPADVAAVPGSTGCSSVAVDPANVNVVLMAFPVRRSADMNTTYPSLQENIYRSTDGGVTFTKGNLNVAGYPNGNNGTVFRAQGERLKVDPNNSNILYYCSAVNGLYRSADGGLTWTAVTAGGVPLAAAKPLNIHYYKNGGTTTVSGQVVSSVIYVVGQDTDVFRSADGGQTWTNISTGTLLSTHTTNSTIDQNGVLWVPQRNAAKVWKYTGTWTTYNVAIYDTLASVAVDPTNANRLFAISNGSAVSRSINGGASWTHFGRVAYANTFGWLPQPVGWRSNGGIYYDANGELWVPQGNEGVLRYMPTYTETAVNWTIQSTGIEEMVAQDVIIPKGSGDKALTATEDTMGLKITDPDQFTASHYNVQTVQNLSAANGISVCPNATNFVAISNSDIFNTGSGANYSGYSNDGGSTWTQFASNPSILKSGSIAVSRRNGWGLGSDHIVILPFGNRPPYYSHDGGATWTATTSFAVTGSGTLSASSQSAFWNEALKQRQLKADPFVANTFYLNLVNSGTAHNFYKSTDGGVTWTVVTNSGIPRYAHNGNLEVNYNLQDDLWFADGIGGTGTNMATHGLFHSAPGSGNVFTKVAGIDYAYTMALGAGRGQSGDAAYTVYFYGKLTGDAAWGIFRSVNAGVSWDRVSYYPAGLIDTPTCMAASWDTFGLVYVGFMGNSYVYGQLLSPHAAFFQNFNASTAIADFTGTGYNQFTTVQQGTGGGFTINGNNELLITHGSDSSNHIMLATGGNLLNSLQTGFILKGTVRAAANPGSGINRYGINLTLGAGGTNPVTDVFFKINGTAAAPTVSLQSQSAGTTGSGGSAVGTPFWMVVNRTGAAVTYTRPDGLSKTLGSGKLDLWFGSDGNNGAITDVWLAYPSYVIDSFWFSLSGSWSSSNGCAVAIDDLKVSKIAVGTTQF